MYEELIKRLRETTVNHDEKCESCSYEEEYPCCVDCLDEMHIEAADAIEEEDMAFRHLERDYKELCAHLPKWIPVTERLPDNIDEEVLVCTEDYGKRGLGFATVAIYDGSGWLECWERETYLTAVTHWMPLPNVPEQDEPQKEET